MTKKELNTYVLYGENEIFIGGGWDKEYGPIGEKIRSVIVGNKNELTNLKTLLKDMEYEYQKPATLEEIEDLRNRFFKKEKFSQVYPDESKIIFADWLSPHLYFEGPMYKGKGKYKNMYIYGYGS